MGRRKRYDPRRVAISKERELRSAWVSPGGSAVVGTAHLYDVTDRNFDRLNRWVFSVRVPKAPRDRVIVSPLIAPGKIRWAGIERRSVVFVPARRGPYRGWLYCKLNVADPSGERTKIGISRGEKDALPAWFDRFQSHTRLKETVTTTRGTDRRAQVAVVRREAHETMIRLFFALKVWVLHESIQVKR